MVDDKSAAEHAAEERWPIYPHGVTDTRAVPDLLRYRSCFVQGAAWQAEQAAVRRVASDRETLIEFFTRCTIQAKAVDGVVSISAESMADALLASGVLVVPADQRTADRETIIDALIQKNVHKVTENGRGGYRCEAGDFEVDWQKSDRDRIRRHVAGFQADAVLAVLVPTDQVRAETLEAAADELAEHYLVPGGIVQQVQAVYDMGAKVANAHGAVPWLRARAAEYRKAAGA